VYPLSLRKRGEDPHSCGWDRIFSRTAGHDLNSRSWSSSDGGLGAMGIGLDVGRWRRFEGADAIAREELLREEVTVVWGAVGV
jgi:hypothetical protein